MSDKIAIGAVFSDHTKAEEAMERLHAAWFSMKQVSVVGTDHHGKQQLVGLYHTGDRMHYWGKLGAFWGGMWGILLSSAYFLIPGIGPVVVAGPLVTCIVGTLQSDTRRGYRNVLAAGLQQLGLPSQLISDYESAIRSRKILVIAQGTLSEVASARQIIEKSNPHSLDLFRRVEAGSFA